jgi:hypothetical protein
VKFKPSFIVIIVLASLFLVFNIVALLTALISPKHIFLLLGGLTAFCITITRLEYGLIMLVFALPWTVQITIAKIPGAAYKIGSDDAILIGMLFGWLGHMAVEKTVLFTPSPLNLPILAFITWAALSFIPLGLTKGLGILSICGLHLIKWVEFAFIYFVVLKVVDTEEKAKRFVILSLISCTIMAAAQLGLTATGRYGQDIYLAEGVAKAVVPGVESNNILGAYYLLSFGIILAMLVSRGIRHKGLIIGLTIALALCVFFTYGRANYLGLASILIVLAITGGGVKVRLPFIFIILLLGTLVYFLPTVVGRISMTVRVEQGGVLEFEQSARERLINWQRAVNVFTERPTNPLIGIGFWGSRFHGAWGYATPHNQFVAYLVEMGIVGLAIFCWLMKRVFHQILLLHRLASPEDYFYKALSIGFMAGVIGVLVNSFFECTLESARIMGPFWLMTGIIVTLNAIKQAEEKEVEWSALMAETYPGIHEKRVTTGRRFVDKYFN